VVTGYFTGRRWGDSLLSIGSTVGVALMAYLFFLLAKPGFVLWKGGTINIDHVCIILIISIPARLTTLETYAEDKCLIIDCLSGVGFSAWMIAFLLRLQHLSLFYQVLPC